MIYCQSCLDDGYHTAAVSVTQYADGTTEVLCAECSALVAGKEPGTLQFPFTVAQSEPVKRKAYPMLWDAMWSVPTGMTDVHLPARVSVAGAKRRCRQWGVSCELYGPSGQLRHRIDPQGHWRAY
jgi:hypothetical protein